MREGTAASGVRGRPRIQETADEAVARLLAGAGAEVDGPAYSTRALAERSGLSQTIVARAVRRLAGGTAELVGASLVAVGDSTAVRRSLRLTRIEVHGGACRVDVADDLRDTPAGPAWVHLRRRAALLSALRLRGAEVAEDLPARLAECVEVPLGVLSALASAEDAQLVVWPAEGDGDGGRGATVGVEGGVEDAEAVAGSRATSWLPRAGVSVTEQLAVRLRDAIIASDLRPGDRLSVAHCARLLDVPRTVAADVLRRMVDDELLDGTRGDVRIPLASADDVIELYAARMLLGDVLLRAAASRPRARLLRARQVLDVLEDAVASGRNAGDADLRFQQEVARASGLEQTVRLFESSTVRVRMLIALLRMDYGRAGRSILADDRRILAALVAGDADRAVAAWHRKTDAAVRHMHGRARHAAFDVALWRRLTAL